MCQGDAAPKQRAEGSLKEAGKLFLKHTTFHGLRHVFLSGSYPRRVAWLLAFLTALALLFTWSSNRVRYLLSSPVYTKAHMVYAKRLVFPAVTICNQNILLPRRMKKPDIFSAGRWLGLFGKNWQVSPAVREALTSHVDGTSSEPPWSPFSRILDFNHFLPPPRDSQPSMKQLLDRLGHQLEEMLLYCRFQGQLCGPRNFSTIFTRYGKCYTFNSGQDGRPLLITMKGGMGNGLELMLDIQQDEYLPVWGETGTSH
ncbi:acid-sensing ion channel 2-like [Puntigrus tetrazona]|uniref:acid-sensing ion channel 2-like n=1 Tax=Puntigrus tetrazona TaxID=1606681 RepID=UPI001C896BC8|nr:acid-sensing ion channel 2-like [Puntigrus tetrazona]